MRKLRTENGVMRTRQGLQTEHIRRRPVEHEKHRHIVAKILPELHHRRFRVGVVPVPHHMPLIRAPDCLHHLRMHYGIVVARKASAGFHNHTI